MNDLLGAKHDALKVVKEKCGTSELIEKISKLNELQNLMGKAIEKAKKVVEEGQKELQRLIDENKESL